MHIDLRQFHQTFFEESREGLAIMERQLLARATALGVGTPVPADPEGLNTMFRVVHSIKGGGGVFGFNDITRFAHMLESCLDDMRAGHRPLDRAAIELLLQCIDGLRTLIGSEQAGAPTDPERVMRLQQILQQYGCDSSMVPEVLPTESGKAAYRLWNITFRPGPALFRSGNDPLRIVRELAQMGRLQVCAQTEALPVWEQMDPESCYLGWTMVLGGSVTRDMIAEVFSWVMDESDIKIWPEPMAVQAVEVAQTSSPSLPVDAPVTSIRVAIHKIDALINSVGELLITQSMLSEITRNDSADRLPYLLAGLSQLERNARALQEGVMRVRMVPLSFIFNRLPRLVHDVSERLGKQVELRISGEQTELDMTVIERIGDPVMHLMRNCLDHGLETPTERVAAGKSETGVVSVGAYQKAGNVLIEIRDDGRGLPYERIRAKAVACGLIPEGAKPREAELAELIFAPGLSTADGVSEVSGRGVGMDVVRRNIASLGGSIEVVSRPGQGTCFTARLPLTLAIVDGLSVRVGSQIYLIPLANIVESVPLDEAHISHPAGGGELVALRHEYLPLIRLQERLEAPSTDGAVRRLVVVVEADGKKAGLCVDDLLDQQQVVLKSLETHYRRPEGVLAATILGDGTVALVLDPSSLVRVAHIPVPGGSNRFTDHTKVPAGKERVCSAH